MSPRSPETISRAVGRPTVDIPLGGKPVIEPRPTPKRRKHTLRNTVMGVAAAGVTFAGIGLAINRAGQENPQPTKEPGGIVVPSEKPTPTPFPIEKPTITLPPTPTPTPTPKPTPTQRVPDYSFLPEPSKTPDTKTLQQRLEDWRTGQTKIPDNKRFTQFGKPLILNLLNEDLNFLEKSQKIKFAYFQGYLLGEEIVDNHLIVYWGLENKINTGERDFIAVNYGDITVDHYRVAIMKKGTSYDSQPTSGFQLNLDKFYQFLQQKTGTTFLFTLYPNSRFTDPILPTDAADQLELNAQSKIADELTKWAFATSHGQSFEMSDNLKSIVNKRIISFDKDTIPHGSQISVFGDR